MNIKGIKKIKTPQRVTDGAGVELNRVIGIDEVDDTDPFLMLDHFENRDPTKEMAGFPWHPHRGIETITYMIKGGIYHEDSLGNKGKLESGDVQWMTAGSGIVHQEMPLEGAGNLYLGFQLWSNLPSTHKMMNPRYQEIKSDDIPLVTDEDGSLIKVITGEYKGVQGPVSEIITNPLYLDIYILPDVEKEIIVSDKKNTFLYVFEGSGEIHSTLKLEPVKKLDLVLFTSGDVIKISSGKEGIRFLLISGEPLNEAIAWSGPIVMNTQEELQVAFNEYNNGTFLKQ
ncbi:MAG: pirin family protein [Spirochaetaceae bacterium]